MNLFVASTAEIAMEGGRKVKLVQETRYPWDAAVRLTVSPDREGRFAVNVRNPGWARGEAVPSGDLYRFADASSEKATLRVNGQPMSPATLEKGYARLDRAWKAGDVIELGLPMPIRRVAANAAVEADEGRLALQPEWSAGIQEWKVR